MLIAHDQDSHAVVSRAAKSSKHTHPKIRPRLLVYLQIGTNKTIKQHITPETL